MVGSALIDYKELDYLLLTLSIVMFFYSSPQVIVESH